MKEEKRGRKTTEKVLMIVFVVVMAMTVFVGWMASAYYQDRTATVGLLAF